jgi:hypothetical protein
VFHEQTANHIHFAYIKIRIHVFNITSTENCARLCSRFSKMSVETITDSPFLIITNSKQDDHVEDPIEPWESQILTQKHAMDRLQQHIQLLDVTSTQVPQNFNAKKRPSKQRRGNVQSTTLDIDCVHLKNVGQGLVNVACVILSVSNVEACNTSYGSRNVVDVLVQDESLEKGHYFPVRLWGHQAANAHQLQPGDVVIFVNLKPWNVRTWLKEKKGESVKRKRTDVQLSTVAKSKWHIIARMAGGESVLLQESISTSLLARFEALTTQCSGVKLVQWTMGQQKKPKPAPTSQFTCCRNFRDNAVVNLVARIMKVSSAPFGMALHEVDAFIESQPSHVDDEFMVELLDEEGSIVKVVLDPMHDPWRQELAQRVNGIYAFLNLRVRWSPILAKGAYYLETIPGLSRLAQAPKDCNFKNLPEGGHRVFSDFAELDAMNNWKGVAWFQARVSAITFLLDRSKLVNLTSFNKTVPAKGVAPWRSNTYGPFSSKWELVRMICTGCNSIAVEVDGWKCGRSRSPCSSIDARFGWSWVPVVLELNDGTRTIGVNVGWNSPILMKLFGIDPEMIRTTYPRRLEILQRMAVKTKGVFLDKFQWEVQCSSTLDEYGFSTHAFHAKNVKLM